MILGIIFINWLIAMTGFFWITLFVGFLFNLKEPVDVSKYFRSMFESYRASKLRGLWKGIILTLEYTLGIVLAVLIKSAYYPALYIRKLLGFIMFSKEDNKKEIRD